MGGKKNFRQKLNAKKGGKDCRDVCYTILNLLKAKIYQLTCWGDHAATPFEAMELSVKIVYIISRHIHQRAGESVRHHHQG